MLNKEIKDLDNSLYIQLQKDLKKKKNKNRKYVPVELFSNIDFINSEKTHITMKQRVFSLMNAIIK